MQFFFFVDLKSIIFTNVQHFQIYFLELYYCLTKLDGQKYVLISFYIIFQLFFLFRGTHKWIFIQSRKIGLIIKLNRLYLKDSLDMKWFD